MKLQYPRPWQYGFIGILSSPSAGPATVELEAVHNQSQRRESFATNGDHFNGRIYFNSYCLADGEYTLTTTVKPLGDQESESFTCTVEILNGPSPLTQSLRHEASLRPQGALVLNALDSSYFNDYPAPLNHRDYAQLVRHRQVRRLVSDQQLSSFDQLGFLHLPAFLDASIVAQARQALIEVNEQESHGFERGSSMRFVNLHETIPALAGIYGCRKLYDVASDLMGYQAYPCQSLTFINGSGQKAHQDTIHLTPFPRGMMCGIWIALEDVVAEAGELFYYPGSHRLDAVLCHTHGVPKVDLEVRDYTEFGVAYDRAIGQLLNNNQTSEKQKFMAKAGDVLIWHENLIHGGCQRERRDQTRMSMVIHTFAEGAYMYFDSSGIIGRRDWPFLDSPPGRPANAPEVTPTAP